MAFPQIARLPRRWLLAAVGLVVAIVAFVAWRQLAPKEETDDAQVAGHVSPISTRVGGAILGVHVSDNQSVKAGDVLVEIDPRDSQLAVSKAEADLASAEAAARAAQNDVPVTSASATSGHEIAEAGTGSAEAALRAAERVVDAAHAKLASAEAKLAEATANATRATQDLDRLKPLVAKDEIPRQQFDAATSVVQAAKAAVDSAAAAVREEQANVDVSDARRAQVAAALLQAKAQTQGSATVSQQIDLIRARAAVADAQVLQARAILEQTKVTLERATIKAPVAGVISRKSVEVGQIVQPGQALLAIATLEDVWVVANFKETQLRDLREGQRASISVDAFGGAKYSGHVDSIAAATGATFSLLPPDNASGNFVKVVQRVPVKIVLDRGASPAVLRPGMSVTATVFLR